MSNGLVVITGGSSGIGKAIVKRFSERKFPILVLDRSGGSEDIRNLPNVITEKADVTDLESLKKCITKVEQNFGPVEGIINNAGVMLLDQFAHQNPEEWRRSIDVNIMGVLNGTNAVLEKMISRKHGTIINISSIAGFKAFPNHAVYGATKYAVHGFTENLRQEVAKYGIRCITISPGVVETSLLSHTSVGQIKEDYSQWKESIGGALHPDDIARTVLFAYEQPKNVCIRDIVIAPTRQEQ